jgi:hypothetical protein
MVPLSQALDPVTDLRQPKAKIRTLWGTVAAIAGALILFLSYAGYSVPRAINSQYFNDYSYPMPDALTVLAAFLALYLLLVAWTGRWRIVSANAG